MLRGCATHRRGLGDAGTIDSLVVEWPVSAPAPGLLGPGRPNPFSESVSFTVAGVYFVRLTTTAGVDEARVVRLR